jgi:UDP-N-acetylmuramoyl-L-alanyl-D-glutamate--2,6-diaminopimelate ligase
MRVLKQLLPAVSVSAIHGPAEMAVSSLHNDSRSVVPGAVFFAVRGTTLDGHQYIDSAISKGAVAIVCEALPAQLTEGVAYVTVTDTGEAMGIMASEFFANPSSQLNLIGITGTNGKTTTATLLYELFKSLGYPTGLISTIRIRIGEKELPTTHTTPDVITINRILREMADAGCLYCFIEVSSHAVDQQRIAGLTFRGGVFSNITHDHLDYHKTFDAYLKAKKAFFDGLPSGAFALVNKDDRNGMVMLQNTAAEKHTYSLASMADFRCRIVENRFQGLQLNIAGNDVWFRLTGRFNAYNLLAAYGTAMLLGQDETGVLTRLSSLEPVAGRFNCILSPQNVTAIVDYAHTPDALKNVLDTINDIREGAGQLITLVGAGGNRDAAKRPLMARIACDLSDRVILTSDNPRFEEPEAIIEDMKKGVPPAAAKNTLVIMNRLEAIRTACALAHPGDIILVAGKGHETYQEVRGVKHHFDDREVVKDTFGMNQQGINNKP